VSRQREYLADASAVQFTRSADGIAGALKRIGGDSVGSRLTNPGAAEISHALFSQGVATSFTALFATHPPLSQRIMRLQPQWNGDFTDSVPASDIADETPQNSAAESTEERQRSAALLGVAAISALQRAGAPDSADLQEAIRVRHQLEPVFLSMAHEPHGARALIYFLLLDPATGAGAHSTTHSATHSTTHSVNQPETPSGHSAQCAYLENNADAGVYQELAKLLGLKDRLAGGDRLALINIAHSALRQLSPAQYQLFDQNMLAILELSAGHAPLSWLHHYLVHRNLRAIFGHKIRRTPARRLAQCKNACVAALSLMAYLGQQTGASALAFDAACDQLKADLPGLAGARILAADKLSRSELLTAVDELSLLGAAEKQKFLLAAAACVQADGHVTPAEQELFQTFAEILGCPTPALF
jgi:hypothetical protein